MKLKYLIFFFCLLLNLESFNANALVAGFTPSVTSGCSPLTVSFTNTSTGATTYSWDFGNLTTSTSTNTSTTYSAPGTYIVQLTAYNGAAHSTASITIIVYGPPTVNFSGIPTTICPGGSVTFTDNSTLNSPGTPTYNWNFGTGGTATGTPATYTFPNPGTFNINLTVTNGAGCISSLTLPAYVTVNTPPIAGFSGNNPALCSNYPVEIFTSSSSGTPPLTYSWTFGDGASSSQTNPQHTYGSTGPFTVHLQVVDGAGCTDTLTLVNYIHVTTVIPASLSGPPSVCVGAPANFNNTSSSFTASTWDFGDGSGTTTGSPAAHTYATAGNYTVSLGSTSSGCTDTARETIIVYGPPPVAFTTTPAQPCPAPISIHFNNPGGAVSYKWYFGDGTTSTLPSPDHVYTTNDTFDVTYVAVNATGCADSITIFRAVTILPWSPSILATAFSGCITFTVRDSVGYAPAPSYPYPIISYLWNFGDGTLPTNSPKPVHTYTQYGIDTEKVTVTTSNGCTQTLSSVVYAGSKDTADFTGAPTTVCVNAPVAFTNLSHGATDYVWLFGDDIESLDTNVVHRYFLPGIYSVSLIAIKNGCPDTLVRKNYIKVNYPKSRLTSRYFCDGSNQIKFYNLSVGANSWKWYFGDGTTDAVSDSPAHTYPSNGTYTVTLIAHNDTTGCSDTSTGSITISQPVPVITAKSAICLNDTLNLTGSTIGGPAKVLLYNWDIDGFNFPHSDTNGIAYIYSSTGNKLIRLALTDYRGCIDTVYKTVLVARPKVDFSTFPLAVCAGTPVPFTDLTTDSASGYTKRMWDFGDGTILNGNTPNPVHTYLNAGTYSIRYLVTDNIGCLDSGNKSNYISVHKPKAGFSISAKYGCVNRGLAFKDLSSGTSLSYSWSFGDGGTSGLQNPVYFYSSTGTYSVTLVIRDSIGCHDSITKVNYVTVEDDPVASFTPSDTISVCPVLIDSFINHSSIGTGITYKWSFGDGNTSTLYNAKNTYTKPGSFNVRLVVTNSYGCTDTASDTVKMLGYGGGFSYSPISGCAPLTVNFITNLTTGVSSYVYDFSDGNTLATSVTSVTHTYKIPGPHLPRLILMGSNGCKATSPGVDTIKVDGIFSGYTYTPNPACGSDTIHFTDTSHGAYSSITRVWIFSDGKTDTTVSIDHYFAPGVYPVTLYTTTATGCHDTVLSHVTVYNLPEINAGRDTVLCVGDTALLLPSGGVSYTWKPAYLISCSNCTNPSVWPKIDTDYIVTGTDVNGCTGTDTVKISLKTKTSGSIDSSGSICRNKSFQLTAHAEFSYAQYTWSPPVGLSNINISNPMANPDSTTVYRVIIREGKCIPDTVYATVTVYPLPIISLGPDQTIFAGSSIDLKTTETGVSTYSWTPADYLNCDDCPDPISTPKQTTIYVVTGFTDHGCTDTARIKITVVCDHSQVYLPNTFTPNGDGANDRFYPRGKGLKSIKSFRIYDRWGELVFSKQNMNTNEINNGWDGTYKGTKLNSDIYVYVIDAICDTGEPITWTGDIALLR